MSGMYNLALKQQGAGHRFSMLGVLEIALRHAAPPYRRFGQHLGYQEASNALRKHLTARNIVPEHCHSIDFVAYGPIFPEQADMATHQAPRDVVAALECKLASALADGGYDVVNQVRSRKPLDDALWQAVREKFRANFPHIAE